MAPKRVDDVPKRVYKPPEASLLAEYVFFPFYDWLVKFYPACWVPNYLTAVGIASTLLASVLLHLSIPAASVFGATISPIPFPPTFVRFVPVPECLSIPALVVIAGVLNAVYCVADNTDGRQARRTKQSSYVGEYLDHGLDCITSLLSTFLVTVAVGVPLHTAAFVQVLVTVVTTLSHELHATDGVFIWGNRFFSVDEAMIAFAVGPLLHWLAPDIPRTIVAVPFVGAVRPLDVMCGVMCLAQVSVFFDVARLNFGNLKRAAVVSQVVLAAFMIGAGALHTAVPPASARSSDSCCYGALVLFIERHLSYPALWSIAHAALASTVAHIPIFSHCRFGHTLQQPDLWPVGAVLIVAPVFAACPVTGVLLAIAVHAVQIFLNIRDIIAAKTAVAKALTK